MIENIITEMLTAIQTQLADAIASLNIFPLLVLVLGATVFYAGYAWMVNKD